jgi:pyruvate/2-oxoglutarate dehydrogenase complex dihydrolipoamide acyltransferase (E2) component
MKKGCRTEPLTFNRKVLMASASVTRRKNTIHCLARADVTEPRRLIRKHFERTGEKLSFTAHVVNCLAQVIKQHPRMNSYIRGNKLVILDEITISVLIEREFEEEKVPEPMGIRQVQLKTYRQISEEMRSAKKAPDQRLGGLSGTTWIRFIPAFLLRAFIRLAERNLKMARRYGKVAVTAVGMFTREPVWFIPHGSATVLLTVGSIEQREEMREGVPETREYLSLTGSFDHNIVDGAPAARFMNQLLDTLGEGRFLGIDV